ncbi:Nucleotide-binding universal stress protein, UspA family [Mesobacillus persicus]|uniref:Nucleotide-binding universal stress protein, UspA family n=1 Tax=Mesobacillus persicus TaxID=930146 RepID=A0A1H7Z6Z3_9BACI|nr:universal stress protein [Mesobacillus persicus]SEM54055.1 Nucleotide-binding universal stress protein, UspA family [Mesobacillus persicus]
MFKNILLAFDGSESSLRTVSQALEIAKLTSDSKIWVVYVLTDKTSSTEVLHLWEAEGIKEDRLHRFKLAEEAAVGHNINYEIKLLRGEPESKIIEFATEKQMDIIVIGSRGLNPFQSMILGSVSHKVMKKATCPVMIIK